MKLGTTKGWELKCDTAGGLNTRSEGFGFLLYIGSKEPLNTIE